MRFSLVRALILPVMPGGGLGWARLGPSVRCFGSGYYRVGCDVGFGGNYVAVIMIRLHKVGLRSG